MNSRTAAVFSPSCLLLGKFSRIMPSMVLPIISILILGQIFYLDNAWAKASPCSPLLTKPIPKVVPSSFFPDHPNALPSPPRDTLAWPDALAAAINGLASLASLRSFSPNQQKLYYSYPLRMNLLRHLAIALAQAPAEELAQAKISGEDYLRVEQQMKELFHPYSLHVLENALQNAALVSGNDLFKKFWEIKYQLPRWAEEWDNPHHHYHADYAFFDLPRTTQKSGLIFQFLQMRLISTFLELVAQGLRNADLQFSYYPLRYTPEGSFAEINIPGQDLSGEDLANNNLIFIMHELNKLYPHYKLNFKINFTEITHEAGPHLWASTMAPLLHFERPGQDRAAMTFIISPRLLGYSLPLLKTILRQELDYLFLSPFLAKTAGPVFSRKSAAAKSTGLYLSSEGIFFRGESTLNEDLPSPFQDRLSLKDWRNFSIEMKYFAQSLKNVRLPSPKMYPALADHWHEQHALWADLRHQALLKIKQTLQALKNQQFSLYLRSLPDRPQEFWAILGVQHPVHSTKTLFYYGQIIPWAALAAQTPRHAENLKSHEIDKWLAQHRLRLPLLAMIEQHLRDQEHLIALTTLPRRVKVKQIIPSFPRFHLWERAQMRWAKAKQFLHYWHWQMKQNLQ